MDNLWTLADSRPGPREAIESKSRRSSPFYFDISPLPLLTRRTESQAHDHDRAAAAAAYAAAASASAASSASAGSADSVDPASR